MYSFKDTPPMAVENITEQQARGFYIEIRDIKRLINTNLAFYEEHKNHEDKEYLFCLLNLVMSSCYNGIHNRYIFLGLENTEKAEHYKKLYFDTWKKFCEIDDILKYRDSIFEMTGEGLLCMKN